LVNKQANYKHKRKVYTCSFTLVGKYLDVFILLRAIEIVNVPKNNTTDINIASGV